MRKYLSAIEQTIIPEAKKTPDELLGKLRKEFLLPYLALSDRQLPSELPRMIGDFEKRKAAGEFSDSSAANFIYAVLMHEKTRLMWNKFIEFAMKWQRERGKTLRTLTREEEGRAFAAYGDREEILKAAATVINNYREALIAYWYFPNERLGQLNATFLYADMLYFQAKFLDAAKSKELTDKADKLYQEVIKANKVNLTKGVAYEGECVQILRKIAERFALGNVIDIEHGLPREDLRDKKTDFSIRFSDIRYNIQLQAAADVESFHAQTLYDNKNSNVSVGTSLVLLREDDIDNAYNQLNRRNGKKIVSEIACGISENEIVRQDIVERFFPNKGN